MKENLEDFLITLCCDIYEANKSWWKQLARRAYTWKNTTTGPASERKGAPTKGQTLRRRGVSGIWHQCWVLIALSFSIPGLIGGKKCLAWFLDLHVEGSWISEPPPNRVDAYTYICTLTSLCARGSALSKQLPREQLVSERERESERGERQGALGGGKVISFWKNTASPSPAKS